MEFGIESEISLSSFTAAHQSGWERMGGGAEAGILSRGMVGVEGVGNKELKKSWYDEFELLSID